MKKNDLEVLVLFCADQRSAFSFKRWLAGNPIDARLLGVTARYLSMTSWYGHDLELESIAEALLPGISDRLRFYTEVHDLRIDIPYLSATIRYQSEQRRTAEGPDQDPARVTHAELAPTSETVLSDAD